MSLFALLEGNARLFRNSPAVTDATGSRSYAEFLARAAGLGASLRRLGIDKGDRVVLCMDNCPAFLEVLFASWAAGACAVPVNAKLHRREVAHIVTDSGARILFATESQHGALSDLGQDAATLKHVVNTGSDTYEAMTAAPPLPPVQAAANDPAWLFYTSGTTGRPKGAILSHRNMLFMSMAYYADIASADTSDQMLHVSPMSHGSGLYAVPNMLRGSEQIILGQFDPEAVIDIINRRSRVSTFLVPTTLTRLMRAPGAGALRTANIGTICYGGAPMYQSDLEAAEEMFPGKLFHVYGQGESPMTITGLSQGFHADPVARATCGHARTGVEVRVVDGSGTELPPGEIGEVVTCSDCVMTGYWNNEAATSNALRDGWLHTGDLGSLDERGLLTLKDRSKDLIISGGSNIYPREIEEVLLTQPDVLEAAVIGMPHPDWGEEVVACVARREGSAIDGKALDALCLGTIARFKRPRRYLFLDHLPKSDYGKILKTALREWVAAGADHPATDHEAPEAAGKEER